MLRTRSLIASICALLFVVLGLVLFFWGFPIVLLWPLLLALAYLGLVELMAGFASGGSGNKPSS